MNELSQATKALKELREDEIRSAAKYLLDVNDMLEGKGEHLDYTQEKIGRCTYCSCGMRIQTG